MLYEIGRIALSGSGGGINAKNACRPYPMTSKINQIIVNINPVRLFIDRRIPRVSSMIPNITANATRNVDWLPTAPTNEKNAEM
jgi:hypothetical protein